MAEIKNTFLKSKMNKDLDSRLVPNGEYRDAQNVSVSKSEGADVGALENILGNSVVTTIRQTIPALEAEKLEAYYSGTTIRSTEISAKQLEIIGYYSALAIDKVFLFLTDYVDSSPDRLSNFASADVAQNQSGQEGGWAFKYKGAMCYIIQVDLTNEEMTVLVAGNWLNFSKTHPIINVNLLENLLFFTDNRNQPRKINIELASNNVTNNGSWTAWAGTTSTNPYYFNEDHISVAKFAPYNSLSFLDGNFNSTLISNSEQFLPFHIVTRVPTTITNLSQAIINIPDNYVITGNNRDIKSGDRLEIFQNDQTFKYTVSSVTQNGSNTQITLTANLNASPNASVANIDASTDIVKVARLNPEYDTAYKGDINLLKDKFPKFSYRFKYDDDEYSLMAPFSQAAFIPEQFGYFMHRDEDQVKRMGTVPFMENRVDQIKLQIVLPLIGIKLENDLKIKELQILVKNSDELAVRVIEDVDVARVASDAGSNFLYEYNYLSSRAIRALPEADLVRVHDKIPVRALTQEVISNRIVYANYLDKHTSPEVLNYDVNVVDKSISNTTVSGIPRNIVARELPNHSLKQNRSYQIGVVLLDRYGRSSNVILNDPDKLGFHKNSTIYTSFKTEDNFASTQYFGELIEFTLRTPVPDTLSRPNYPGLYSETNPLGWYTYRIVVKQQEQEYYNVYLPGAIAGDLIWDVKTQNDPTSLQIATRNDRLPSFVSKNEITLLNLFGDNINKIPRDFTNASGNDETFSVNTLLFNRVNNRDAEATSPFHNSQGETTAKPLSVISVKPYRDLGAWTRTKGQLFPGQTVDDNTNSTPQPWHPYFPNGTQYDFHDIFYNAQSNPLIAKINTHKKIGATPSYGSKEGIENSWKDLSVFETNPVKSAIDIFWESSTAGKITDFNLAAEDAVPAGIKDTLNNQTVLGQSIQYIHTEAMAATSSNKIDVTTDLFLTDSSGGTISTAFTANLTNVVDGNGNSVLGDFHVVQPNANTFKIQVQKTLIYTFSSPSLNSYTFQFTFTDTSGNNLWTGAFPVSLSNMRMQNIIPTWLTQPSTSTINFFSTMNYVYAINQSHVTNGCGGALVDKLTGLQFNITDQATVAGASGDFYSLEPVFAFHQAPSGTIGVLNKGPAFNFLPFGTAVSLKIQMTDAVIGPKFPMGTPNPTGPANNNGITVTSNTITISKLQ